MNVERAAWCNDLDTQSFAAIYDTAREITLKAVVREFRFTNLHATLLIDAPLELRTSRVMKRSGLSLDTVLARDAAQMPAEEKRRRATVVVDNAGDEAYLEAGLLEALRVLGIRS